MTRGVSPDISAARMADTDDEFITYAILKCADVVRDEQLNIGVLVFDLARQEIAFRTASDLGRIQRALPGVPVAYVREHLTTLFSYLEGQSHAALLSPELLSRYSTSWSNVLRMSPPQTILASSCHMATELLYERFVASAGVAGTPAGPSAPRARVTSRRLVRQVETRLRKRGFLAGRDFSRDTEVDGLTQNADRVPVWFPLFVSRQLLIDTMWVMAEDEERSVDGARLLASKAEEVLRSSEGLDVSVVLGASDSPRLNRLVETVVREEGRVGDRWPDVYWQEEVAALAAAAPQPQLLLGEGGSPA
jgi:DUF3037 family protein